jgi:hypothetical protein
MTRRRVHAAWCAGGYRAFPVTVAIPGVGRAVPTRVRTAEGAKHAEIRLSVTLPDQESHARARLTALLTHLTTLIGPERTNRPHRSDGQ